MIVGTAGHIDHGKTSLVRALTGVDTDRLAAEKARGISIELGYAYAPLPDGEVLGFIDVPGHEKLIHTMAAGACGIHYALLVIAADDGVMPQTREHLAILTLLGVTRGAVVLTKIDRVDDARQTAARADIAALLAGTRLQDAPVFPVNATDADDVGIVVLREHLAAEAAQMRAREMDDASDASNASTAHEAEANPGIHARSMREESRRALFRLPVDRVFTLTGQGTVVTGTAFSGRVAVGDVLALMPAGTPVRVRSLHAQHRPVDIGEAGQRCALNLAGIDRQAIARGDWIASPGWMTPSLNVDVEMHWLPGAPTLTQWFPLHVHLGTAHVQAHAVLLDGEALAPGASMRVQLVFDTPVCAMPGDRFIVRNPQASATIGGGRVLDPYAPSRRRRSSQRLAWLGAIAQMLDGNGLDALLTQSPQGLTTQQLMALTGQTPSQWTLPSEAVVIPMEGEHVAEWPAQAWLSAGHWEVLCGRVEAALTDCHARWPDEPGVEAARLLRMTWPTLDAPRWRALLAAMLREGCLQRTAAWWHLPSHRVTLSAQETALAARLMPMIDAGMFDPPWVRDLARDVGATEVAVRVTLQKLSRQGHLHQVVKDLFYASARMSALARLIDTLVSAPDAPCTASGLGSVEAGRFRDATGLGRKRAIQILEFFDRAGYTRRVGDAHVRRPDSVWADDVTA